MAKLPLKPNTTSLTQRIAQPRPVPPAPSSVPGLAATPAHDWVQQIQRERAGLSTREAFEGNRADWGKRFRDYDERQARADYNAALARRELPMPAWATMELGGIDDEFDGAA